ncbi:MAG: fused response regulator/phosphatase [Betaproteobacteria bacterium]|nr:fused response regulator/phosphatase [Betaproteobacteria bacterium]
MHTLKILIVDDTPANARLVETVVSRMGHATLIAENGQQALDLFEAHEPDLVLMDVMMPVMDGIAATKALRKRLQATHRWVPILLLSALDDISDIVRGLEAGADDYVVKPVNIQLLKAKVQNFTHQIEMQEQLLQHTAELEKWRAEAQVQTELGSHIMARLVSDRATPASIGQFNIPAEDFSGDLVCSAYTPDGTLHLLLADATGHGLPAALTAIPTAHAFYSMTGKGFPIASIAREINHKLHQFLPTGRFVAVTLAAVDLTNRSIEVRNAGNPGVLLIDTAGALLKEWESRHPPLGILPEISASDYGEIVRYKTDCTLLICSDGLWEAEDSEGRRISRERILALFSVADRHTHLDGLRSMVRSHLGDRPAHDDVSCVMAWVPVDRRVLPRVDKAQTTAAALQGGEWRLALTYSAHDLKYLDVIPGVLDLMHQVQLLQPHKSSLFTILSELFNNALDHGLLGLDSGLKANSGFEAYLQERSARLARLSEGRIDIALSLHNNDSGFVLDITVTDSGTGFDFSRYLMAATNLLDRPTPYGRGIALVQSLCSSLRYAGNGNQVSARFQL